MRFGGSRLGELGICALGILALGASGGCIPDPVPPTGSYRIANADNGTIGGAAITTPGGKVAIVEVAYQGPREWVEIVIENWDGPTLQSTETLLKAKFGSLRIEKIGTTTNTSTGPAFLHLRQVYSIWMHELPEVLDDGRNAFCRVSVGDPEEPNIANTHSALVRLESGYNVKRAAGDERPNGQQCSRGQGFGRSGEVLPDSEPAVLWEESRSRANPVGGDPPYPAGVTMSRVVLRFVGK